MKYAYRCARPLLAALFLLLGQRASAQQFWRPFRPGLIYSYKELSGPTSNLIYTMRVDSAYATSSGDSVYAFNRLLRASTTTTQPAGSVKSRNNLFGASLRWRPGQRSFILEAQAQPNVQAAVSLELFPRAVVGSTWSAGTQPLSTATLVSRGWQTISAGVQDTVAVISITSGGATTTVRLSRAYGLLVGPQWLGGATGSPLEQAVLPASFSNSLYNPVRFFDVQPGDEFGYQEFDLGMSSVRCYDRRMLRRIVSKRLTTDSLIVTYQEQSRHEDFGYTGQCTPPASVTYSPIQVKRWQIALAGNQWQPTGPVVQVAALRLLTGEYRLITSPTITSTTLLVGAPIDNASNTGCAPGTEQRVAYLPYYLQSGGSVPIYKKGLDYAAWQYTFVPGRTTSSEGPGFMGQVYYRKTVNGTVQTCGSRTSFVNMLATHAAQAAAIATLAPNPATEAATLTLAQPARPGTGLRLTDALGREVWRATVSAGQSAVTVPLAGQPAGLYLLRMSGENAPAATWKLVRE